MLPRFFFLFDMFRSINDYRRPCSRRAININNRPHADRSNPVGCHRPCGASLPQIRCLCFPRPVMAICRARFAMKGISFALNERFLSMLRRRSNSPLNFIRVCSLRVMPGSDIKKNSSFFHASQLLINSDLINLYLQAIP